MGEREEREAFVTEGSRRLTGDTNASGAQEAETANPEASSPSGPEEVLTPGLCSLEQSGAGEGEDTRDFQQPAPISDLPVEAGPEEWNEAVRRPQLMGMRKGKRAGRALKKKARRTSTKFTPEQRLLILDTWQRSGLPAKDFSELVGMSAHTLYVWKKRFEEMGPGGLVDKPRGRQKGSRLPEITRRAILMLKEANPEYGCQRISDMLLRGPALPASPNAVARVLHEAGYERKEVPTRAHPDKKRRFERAKPNQLWQTDIFTFILKRQNRRLYLVAFLDDNSRYIVGYGLHASCSTALVLEVLRAAVASFGAPEEILTDNGPQYVTWRGKSKFTKEMEKMGIRQIVSKAKRPQTLGKIERFWGTIWRECAETSVFLDLEDARRRIGLFIDHYNFQRPHQGIGGLVPADRYFEAAPEVLKSMKERVTANALEIARHGVPKEPFYLTGQVGGRAFSVHSEGDRMILKKEGEERKEVDLIAPGKPEEADLPEPLCPGAEVASVFQDGREERAPGTSPLDEGLRRLEEGLLENTPEDTHDPAAEDAVAVEGENRDEDREEDSEY